VNCSRWVFENEREVDCGPFQAHVASQAKRRGRVGGFSGVGAVGNLHDAKLEQALPKIARFDFERRWARGERPPSMTRVAMFPRRTKGVVLSGREPRRAPGVTADATPGDVDMGRRTDDGAPVSTSTPPRPAQIAAADAVAIAPSRSGA